MADPTLLLDITPRQATTRRGHVIILHKHYLYRITRIPFSSVVLSLSAEVRTPHQSDLYIDTYLYLSSTVTVQAQYQYSRSITIG